MVGNGDTVEFLKLFGGIFITEALDLALLGFPKTSSVSGLAEERLRTLSIIIPIASYLCWGWSNCGGVLEEAGLVTCLALLDCEAIQPSGR